MCVSDKDFPPFCYIVQDRCGELICRNYSNSRVLPISLLLLDSSTYKHVQEDIFTLSPYCHESLGFDFIEVNELTGNSVLREKIEQMKQSGASKLVVYIYQSDLQKQENIKQIIDYCLHCRVGKVCWWHVATPRLWSNRVGRVVLFPWRVRKPAPALDHSELADPAAALSEFSSSLDCLFCC